ncbi:MAG TPA: Arc family DNA binding domain-containing protein [Thermoanaerobaculia bacterium]|nr:Arc family DNA binding domain-containing protein [Thermoanaerobaculia bacterium]
MAERKAFPLRIDPEVFEALRAWADDELRSVNAQIEFLLTRALRDAGRAPRGKKKGGAG